MGKKKYTESNATISECISIEYIDELRNNNIPDVLSNLTLLAKNNLAITISDSSSISTSYPSLYRTASKFIQKYNETLKSYRKRLSSYEYGGSDNTMAEDHGKLIKLAKCVLENGVYYAQLDSKNYCVLELSEEDDGYIINSKLSFIGEDWRHWKTKFDKFSSKYKKYMDETKRETIRDIDNSRDSKVVVFKPFSQMIFKGKDEVMTYIDNWLDNIPIYYKKYNMIAKLSIILYGDPGTGKSTFAKALAKHLGISSITTVKPSHFSNRFENSNTRAVISPYNSTVYCLDDIDCYCRSREESQDKENGEILANLLAFLDNPPTVYIKCKDGISYPVSIIVATTNYFEKLDDAVKRYGRFDLRIHMPLFTRKEADEMCSLYDLRLEDLVKDSNNKDFTISPSYLQALCLENIDKNMKKST